MQNRIVKTPLWTDHPEKMAQFGYDEKNASSAEQVAQDMIMLVTEGKYGSGTSLESTVGGSRVLGTWNIEPPAGTGTGVPKEIMERNYRPILEKLRLERGEH
jgi:hypothetical protein